MKAASRLARFAAEKGEPDFPVSIKNVAARLGVSFQYVSELRKRFVDASIIVPTAPPITNRSAPRFRWTALTIKPTPVSAVDL